MYLLKPFFKSCFHRTQTTVSPDNRTFFVWDGIRNDVTVKYDIRGNFWTQGTINNSTIDMGLHAATDPRITVIFIPGASVSYSDMMHCRLER